VDPYDVSAHELALAVYQKSNNAAGIARETQTLPKLATWWEDYRKSMALPGAPVPK
jgi:hypothetical protein